MVLLIGMRRHVRILLVGERGVGKTSLILSLVSEEFPEDVPPKAEEITIPADVTPEQVPTHIVDYSAAEQTDEQLAEEIQRAHVVCVVYSVEDEDTLDKVTSRWLPLIRECCTGSCPIILVGNKVDLVDYSTIDAGYSIMEDFPEVESVVECSARSLRNISEMFYYAQKAVLHPTSPLYIIDEKTLTDGCKKALVRIFKVCDSDNDGLLNDAELNAFQRRCFNAPLQPQVLEDVKTVLRKNLSDGVAGDAITLKGFLFLHCLFIQRGRNETTWTVLRKFGYGDDLQIAKEYLHPPLRVPVGCSTELSHKGHQFLSSLFERYDKDGDGALSPSELDALFAPCPGFLWERDPRLSAPTNEQGWLTQQGFISQWVLLTLVDVQRVLAYFAYLGYNITESENQLTAVLVTRDKKIDLAKKQTSRNVFQCHVIGARSSGKSMLCRTFIGNTLEETSPSELEGIPQRTVNSVQVYGQEKYLVLRDIDVRNISDPLHPSEVHCDVACLVYDISCPTSFEYCARIYLKYFVETKIPVLMVANKQDLQEVRQEYLLQPEAFCSRYKLPPPQPFTSSGQPRRDLFVKLATMAAFPHLKQLGLLPADSGGWWRAGLGLAAASAVALLVVRVLKGDKR